MRLLNIRGFLGILAGVLVCVVLARLSVWYLEERAIERRRSKTEELETLAAALHSGQRTLSSVLAELDSPTAITVASEVGNTHRMRSGRVSIRYEYVFSVTPWHDPERTSLEISFDTSLSNLRAGTSQTFR